MEHDEMPTLAAAPLAATHLHRALQDEIGKRKEADEALRAAENKYQSIFEHALEGIFQTSADGEYIAANPALIRMYGYGSFEELAQNVSNIATELYVDPNRRTEFIRLMQAHGQVLHFESEVRRRDGTTFWISENVRSIWDDAENFLYYEGTVDDVTEIKRARERLQQMLEALERTRQRLENELTEAADYMRSLLPAPLQGPIAADWCYLPCSHLGGDGFGYHWLDADTLALYLLDVSGHGVGAALLCISVLNVLRTHSLRGTNFKHPSAVLEGLNRAFPIDQNNDKYFTVWYGVCHLPSRKLTYASAGHHAAVLMNGPDTVSLLQLHGPVVGAMPDSKYPSAEATLSPSAELYLFSDGVYEIARPDGSYQAMEEFAGFLQECRPDIGTIVRRMRDLRQRDDFDDDFSLVHLKVS